MEKIISWREKGETVTGTEYEFHLVGIPDKTLLNELDRMVQDKTDAHYRSLRAEVEKRMKMTINPFRAGRPHKYGEADYEKVRKLRDEGNTVRAIASETGISIGTISKIIRDVQ